MKKLILIAIAAIAITACNNTPVVGEVVDTTDSIDSVEVVDTVITDTFVIDTID
jgi:hypothetical protein